MSEFREPMNRFDLRMMLYLGAAGVGAVLFVGWWIVTYPDLALYFAIPVVVIGAFVFWYRRRQAAMLRAALEDPPAKAPGGGAWYQR